MEIFKDNKLIKYLIPMITLSLGLVLGYIFNKPITNEIKITKQQETQIKEPQTTLHTNNNIIEKQIKVLPFYIKDSLEEKGISSKELTIEKWNEFLRKEERQNYDNLNTLSDGGSILHLAAQQNSKEFVSKLLELGYDINQKDRRGLTPLLKAINKDTKVEFINFLVENGADLTNIKKISDSDKDALSLALGKGIKAVDDTNEELVEYLLDNGFTLNKIYFRNVISSFSQNRDTYLLKIIDTLDTNEINPDSYRDEPYFNHIVFQAEDETISYMLNNKIDLENYPKKEELLLSMFASNKISNDTISRILKEGNISLETTNERGVTALMSAVRYGNIQKVQFLLEKGIDINIKDKQNRTIYDYLDYGIKTNKDTTKEMKKLLDDYAKEGTN